MCAGIVALSSVFSTAAMADLVYLNHENINVELGEGMPDNPFANRSAEASLASIIDADSAASLEYHNQGSHVWVNGSDLKLWFDFGIEYDITTFHFWNYSAESHDVDNIDWVFYNSAGREVGSVLGFAPRVGTPTLSAENYDVSFPSNVQFVSAHLSGSNNQVDFNNIGFTASISQPVPAPASLGLFGLAGLMLLRRQHAKS